MCEVRLERSPVFCKTFTVAGRAHILSDIEHTIRIFPLDLEGIKHTFDFEKTVKKQTLPFNKGSKEDLSGEHGTEQRAVYAYSADTRCE